MAVRRICIVFASLGLVAAAALGAGANDLIWNGQPSGHAAADLIWNITPVSATAQTTG